MLSNKLLASLLALTFGSVGMASADVPVSPAAGVARIALPAGPGLEFVGLPYQTPLLVGLVDTTASGNIITDAGAFGSLTTGTTDYSVRIVGGGANGTVRNITASTSDTITLDGAAISGVDTIGVSGYEVYENATLGSIFGTTELAVSASLKTGATAAEADKIFIEDGGVVTSYFFKIPGFLNPGEGWRAEAAPGGSDPDEAGADIAFGRGIMIQRPAAATASTIVLSGSRTSGTVSAPMVPSANIISNMFPLATTLEESGLADSLTQGATAAEADLVFIEDGGVVTSYFYKIPGFLNPGEGWRAEAAPGGADPDQGATTILAGAAIYIIPSSVTTAVEAKITEPFAE